MLTDFENEKQLRADVLHLNQLFVKAQEAHDAYLKALDDDEWFSTRDKDVLQLKQRIVGFLNDAEKLRGGFLDSDSVKSKSSRHLRHSLIPVSSTKLEVRG